MNKVHQHRAGDGSYYLRDINGLPCCRVCEACETIVKAQLNQTLESDRERRADLTSAHERAERFNLWRIA